MSSLRFFLFAAKAAAVLLCVVGLPGGVQAGKRGVRALYIFGDSLVDVGNNQYLPFSVVRADFPHNGIDFPGHKATGRFSNGGNAADFIAMNLGMESPPPYLTLAELHETGKILTGVNFASGGARILGGTVKEEEQYIPLNKQIDYFIQVHQAIVQKLGPEKARKHMASSLFVVVIGSNDIFHYVRCDGSFPPQMFVDFVVEALGNKLEMMYGLGARMLVFVGAGPLGCCPSHRLGSQTRECDELANEVSLRYNGAVCGLLERMKAEHNDLNYSFFDTYKAVEDYIRDPTSYGEKFVRPPHFSALA